MKLSSLDFQLKVSNTIVTTRPYVLFFLPPPHTRLSHRFNWVNQPPPPPPTGYVCSIPTFFLNHFFILLLLVIIYSYDQRFPNTPTNNL